MKYVDGMTLGADNQVIQLIYYSPTLFEQLGLDYEMQIDMSGVLNIIQFVACIVAFFIIDRVGRKPLLLFGSTANTICHVIVAVVMAKFSHDWVRYSKEAWVAVAFIFIYIFTYGVGWAPVPWAMRKLLAFCVLEHNMRKPRD